MTAEQGRAPATRAPTTNWVFTNVLAQIGLGYVFVFLLAGRGWTVQLAAIAAILVGYTLLFGLWPVGTAVRELRRPRRATDYGTPPGWQSRRGRAGSPTGTRTPTPATTFDVRFLNLFPRAEPFVFNNGGYQTLNFVPSMVTMILGLMAGELLRERADDGAEVLSWLLAAGGVPGGRAGCWG